METDGYPRRLRMRRLFFAVVSALLCAAFLGGSLCPAAAFAADLAASGSETQSQTERTVIRVGFPQQEGLTFTTEEGVHEGYTYEYLEQIAQYTGWTYEFVTPEGDINEQLTVLTEMLESGEIDVLGAMSYNDALAETYDFAIKPYGFAHTALFAANGNTSITDTNVYDLASVRVGTLGAAPSSSAELKSFCAMNGIELEIVQCATMEELIESTEEGVVDLALGVDVSLMEGLHLVTSFTPKPFYFATTKGNQDIVSKLNEAITSIDNSEPQLQVNLYKKYFGSDVTVYGLSPELKDFIAQSDPIRVGYSVGEAPIQDTNGETGELEGATKGALEYIAEYTGLSIEAVPIPENLSVTEAVAELELDVLAGVPHDFDYAHENDLSLSSPYLRSQSWLVINNSVDASDLSQKRLAVTNDRRIQHPSVENVAVYETVQECIFAVDAGRADYTYVDGYTAPFYINTGECRNIAAIPDSSSESNICFAFPAPSQQQLLQVFNKAIEVMPSGVVNASIYGEISQTQQMTIERFVKDFAVEIVVVGLLIAAVIIALAILYARARSKAMIVIRAEKERLKIKAEQDDLTGLLSVGAFRDRAAHLLREGDLGAFLIVDIDDFKLVNDTWGHRTGDEALVALADALRQTFRDGDVVGRFGGDEFAIGIKGSIDEEALEARCRDLLARVKAVSEAMECTYSISIGAAIDRGNERYADLYERADRALYKAKREGKNGYSIG